MQAAFALLVGFGGIEIIPFVGQMLLFQIILHVRIAPIKYRADFQRAEVPVGGHNVYTSGPAFGIPDSQVVTSAAQSSLIARMVDVETGSILWSGRMSYEGYDTQSAMAAITGSFAKSLVPLWPALRP